MPQGLHILTSIPLSPFSPFFLDVPPRTSAVADTTRTAVSFYHRMSSLVTLRIPPTRPSHPTKNCNSDPENRYFGKRQGALINPSRSLALVAMTGKTIIGDKNALGETGVTNDFIDMH